MLRSASVAREPKRKRELIKKVIAYMTLGLDVSRLFPEMMMAIGKRASERKVAVEMRNRGST
eukprot:scaffold109_cov252-Pinguiococcus_pyrenoidosus.AAC.102